ncbi:MAG: class I SAM-dependent methyltransferase [Deltaproteobacteria bacterium]|nr:class I SAM-dependent methyltransferase [Deltaproteobacteria bacterium]
MKLNRIELWMMNNPLRRAGQRWIELPLFERMLRRAGVDLTGKRLLDAGCGSGFSTELLARRLRPGRLVGFDLMPEQIERARARCPEAELRVGDISAIAEPDGAFDAVFVFGILHHVPEWREALREIHRVLAPGGVLLVEELHGRTAEWADRWLGTEHPRAAAFDWPTFRGGLEAAGLEIVEWRRLSLGTFASFLCRRPG